MENKTNEKQGIFQCHKCNYVFAAKDTLDLRCPKCGSDNIDEKRQGYNQLILKVLVFLLATSIGYVLASILRNHNSTGVEPTPQSLNVLTDSNNEVNNEQVYSLNADERIENIDFVQEPIKVKYQTPINVDGRYVYSFEAYCNYNGKSKVVYQLLESPYSPSPFIVSPNGQFSEIPASKDAEGFYWLCAFIEDEDRYSDTVRVEGFKKRPIDKVDKVTFEELTTLLNKREASKNNKYFNHPVKVDVAGLKEYSNINSFESFLKLKNKKVKVIDAEYSTNNKVTHIKVEILDN